MTYLTVTEFAKAAKISERLVYNLVKAKKIKAVRFGSTIRIPEDELLARK